MKLRMLSRLRMKRSQKRYRNIMIAVFLSFVFVSAGQCIQESAAETDRQQRYDQYGEWKAAVYGAENETVKALTSHASVEQLGIMRSFAVGETVNRGGSCQMGTVDEALQHLGHLRLAEGAYPNKTGEIAMERATLSMLGYSYDLGQKIQLKVHYTDGDGGAVTAWRSYRLVGTLKTFSVNWKVANDVETVTAILSPEDSLCKLSVPSNHIFFSGQKIDEESVSEFAAILSGKEQLVYNDHSYSPQGVGLSALFEKFSATIVLWLGGVCFIFYTASLTLNAQDEELKAMGMLGASQRQLRRLLLFDFLRILLYTALPGSAAGLGLAYAIVALQNKWMEPSLLLQVNPGNLFLALLIVCLAVCVGTLWPLFNLKLEVEERKSDCGFLREAQRNTMRVGHFKTDFLKRQFLSEKRELRLRVLAISMVSLTVFASLSGLVLEYQRYEDFYNQGNAAYRFFYEPGQGLEAEAIHALRKIEGISEVDAVLWGSNQNIRWEGCEASPYRQLLYSDGYGAVNRGVTAALDSDSPLFAFYSQECSSGAITSEELDSGRCIVVLPALTVGPDGGYRAYASEEHYPDKQAMLAEKTLTVGDAVAVESELGGFEAQVAGIIYDSADQPLFHSAARMGNLQPMSVIVSKAYLESYFNVKFQYNDISIYGEERLLTETTDKEVARVQGKGKMEFFNFRERQENEKMALIRTSSFVFLFAAFTLALGGMILFYNALNYYARKSDRILLFKALGMSPKLCRLLDRRLTLRLCFTGMFYGFLPVFFIYFCLPFITIYKEERWGFSLRTSFLIWMEESGRLLSLAMLVSSILLGLYFFFILKPRNSPFCFNR